MKKIAIALLVSSSLFALPSIAPLAFAAPTTMAGTTTGSTPQKLENPLGVDNINQGIGKVINAALGLTGAIALLMFVWGGVQWLISGGNADMVKKGKATLTWAALGIVVIFTAYTLVNVLVQTLAGVSS